MGRHYIVRGSFLELAPAQLDFYKRIAAAFEIAQWRGNCMDNH